jgi:CubicO group peptidase (beta-lactamase class C family)
MAAHAPLRQSLDKLVQQGISQRLFTAACYEVHWQGGRVARGEWGRLSASSQFPATRTALFDLASLTKPTATALSVLRLVSEGRLALDDTLGRLCADLLPARPDPPATPLRCHPKLRRATVRHLLTHTSGIAAWEGLYKRGLGRWGFVQAVLGAEPKHKLGTRYEYSCLGYIVLGEIASAAAQMPLDAYARGKLHLPAGMKDTCFCPGPADWKRAAATERCPWRRKRARGFVHDENAFSLGGVAGNAGLFSTAADLSRLFRRLLSRRPPFTLPDPLHAAYTTNQLHGIGAHSSCGWFTHDSDMLPRPPRFSGESFGHTGFTGTSATLDPANDGFVFLLTNRVYYGRAYEPFRDFRRLFNETVGSHLPGA